jgi:hypothetical protein
VKTRGSEREKREERRMFEEQERNRRSESRIKCVKKGAMKDGKDTADGEGI